MKSNKIDAIHITEAIQCFVEESLENTLGGAYKEKSWGSPLVGFSKGNDELYSFFKSDIGDFYLTPKELFNRTFPDLHVGAEELTIISWIIPQTELTKEEQRREKRFPTERAVLARVNGEEFNKKIANYVVNLLTRNGHPALAPMLSPLFETKDSVKYGFASNWSERHTAYVGGLGTFGLSDALITPVGKAIRCGSVIAHININASPRNYSSHNEYCLFFQNGGCMKCAERCPAEAITAKGHDKNKCKAYQVSFTGNHNKQVYQLDSQYCGICQFGIPCESKIP